MIPFGNPTMSIGYRRLNSDIYPAMTSNTSPTGHVITTSSPNGQNPEWRVFDKVIRTGINYDWFANGQDTYIQRQLPTSDRIWKYGMRVLGDGIPSAWQFLGSNDGITFTLLDSATGQTIAANGSIYREIPRININRYNRYRLRMTASLGGGFISLSELELLKEV